MKDGGGREIRIREGEQETWKRERVKEGQGGKADRERDRGKGHLNQQFFNTCQVVGDCPLNLCWCLATTFVTRLGVSACKLVSLSGSLGCRICVPVPSLIVSGLRICAPPPPSSFSLHLCPSLGTLTTAFVSLHC